MSKHFSPALVRFGQDHVWVLAFMLLAIMQPMHLVHTQSIASGGYIELAYGKPTYQSSNPRPNWTPSGRAVDGEIFPSWDTSLQCADTGVDGTEPWW